MLSAQQMQSLPDFFADIPDPRRAQGRRHRLATVLSISAGAILCGMHGYLAISDWAENLSQNARKRFNCRYQNKRYIVPSLSTIRDSCSGCSMLEQIYRDYAQFDREPKSSENSFIDRCV